MTYLTEPNWKLETYEVMTLVSGLWSFGKTRHDLDTIERHKGYKKKKKKKRKKWSWKLRCKNKANIWELVWQPNISQVLGDTHKVKIQLVLSDGIFLPRNVWSVSSTQVVKHFCTQNIKDVTRLLTVNKLCRARSFFTILPMQAFCDIHMPFTKNL